MVTTKVKKLLLLKPINELPVSGEFRRMAGENGFETLEEVLSFNLPSLLNKKHFSIHILNELYNLLEKEDMVRLLKND